MCGAIALAYQQSQNRVRQFDMDTGAPIDDDGEDEFSLSGWWAV